MPLPLFFFLIMKKFWNFFWETLMGVASLLPTFPSLWNSNSGHTPHFIKLTYLPWNLSVFLTDMKVLLCMKSNSEWSVYLRSRSSTWMGSEMIWSAAIMVISGLVRFIASLANGDILKPYTSDQKSTEDFLNLNDHSMIHLRNT